MSTFKDRVRELRNENSWSLKDLGNRIGKSESTISLYESGAREPNKALDYIRIADLFGVTLDYLMGRTEHRDGLVIKEEIDGDIYEFEVDRNVYPNGLSKEEIMEKLEILKKLEDAGFEYKPKE
jgi:transcriptional regulator with XRE-family HTH domain